MTFTVTEIEPSRWNSNARFEAKATLASGETLTLHFRGDGTEMLHGSGERAFGRSFPIVGVKLDNTHLVSGGTSNHVPTIDAMRDLVSPQARALADAQQRAADARAALRQAQRDIGALRGF